MRMSATLVRVSETVFSSRLVSTGTRVTEGGSFTSVTARAKAALSSGLAPTSGSSTWTVTAREGLVSKSRVTPALRKSSAPWISKRFASAPTSESAFVPWASSSMRISATLVRVSVPAFSARLVSTGVRVNEGGSFASVMDRAKAALSSGLPPTSGSSTCTVTPREGLVSKSRATPALRKSAAPWISKSPASAPTSESAFVPWASSSMRISATLVRVSVPASSARLVNTGVKATVGGSFTSVMVRAKSARSSGVLPRSGSSTWTVTAREGLVSKSSAAPAFRKSSAPWISKRFASAPTSERALLPKASSSIRISATLVRVSETAFSARLVSTGVKATEGGSLAGGRSGRTIVTVAPSLCRPAESVAK